MSNKVSTRKYKPPHPRKINLKTRKPLTILHQPLETQIWRKIRKNGQNLNGISVSETPKIGERPYPSPFHPVEIRGKIRKI